MDFFQVVFPWPSGRLRGGHLQTELIGGAIGPREHGSAVLPHAQCSADFSEPFAQTGNLLFLIAHDLRLASELCLQRVQMGQALFERSDATIPLLQQ